ncbi:MAG: hypothetical protein LBQ77_00385 [Treponema sp.]|jgi:hypothetical protein|nr:hypothetical protein [Treponema sp.]
MKNLFLVVLALAVITVSCKSTQQTEEEAGKNLQGLSSLPDWYRNPPVTEDAIFGRGAATMADLNRAQGAAQARAKQSIAFVLDTTVKAMITDYTRQAGTDEEQTALNFYESVSRQLTQARLSGVQTYREDYIDGTYYVVMFINKSDLAKSASQYIENEAAKYAEFKAMDAVKQMNYELEKLNAQDSLGPSYQ